MCVDNVSNATKQRDMRPDPVSQRGEDFSRNHAHLALRKRPPSVSEGESLKSEVELLHFIPDHGSVTCVIQRSPRRRLNIDLSVDGGRIVVDAPIGATVAEMRAFINAEQIRLIRQLQTGDRKVAKVIRRPIRRQQDRLIVNGHVLDITVLRSPRRKKYVTMQLEYGRLIVRVPPRASIARVRKYVLDHTDWIFERLTSPAGPAKYQEFYHPGQIIPWLGCEYRIQVDLSSAKRVHLQSTGNIIFRTADSCEMARHFEAWGRRAAHSYVRERTSFWAVQMGENISIDHIHIMPPTSEAWTQAWGVCYQESRNIDYDWKVGLLPPNLADQVIVHELAHLKHLGHGTDFWQWVSRHQPNTWQLDRQLDAWRCPIPHDP